MANLFATFTSRNITYSRFIREFKAPVMQCVGRTYVRYAYNLNGYQQLHMDRQFHRQEILQPQFSQQVLSRTEFSRVEASLM